MLFGQTLTDTVDTCWASLSGTGVNSHYSHVTSTYVESVELTFGTTGATVTFGGPKTLPSGFTSENFDQNLPKGAKPVTPTLTNGIPVAGIEIGDKIRELLEELETKFAELFEELEYEQMLEIIKNTAAQDGWEIVAFFGLGKDNFYDIYFNNRPTDMDSLLGSITIDGKPYWAAEANYILWGFSQRMFHEHLLAAGKGQTVRNTHIPPVHGTTAITISHYRRPDGLMGDKVITLKNILLWVEAWRAYQYGSRFFSDNPLPERRSTGLGIKGRLDFTKVGWDYYGKGPGKRGDFSIPPDTQISDRPVQANPNSNPCEKFDFKLYIGGTGPTKVEIKKEHQ